MNELIRYLFRRLKKNQRGAALLEFAIVIPLLLILVLGVIEFGWLLTGWVVITGAAREGVRVAVVGRFGEINDRVFQHTTSLPFVGVTATPVIDNPGGETSVTVSGNLPLLVGFFPMANPFPIQARATMRQEY